MCRVLAPLLLLALGGAGIAGYLYGRDTHDPRYMVMSQPIPILALTGTGPTLPNTSSLVCMLPYFLLTLFRVLVVHSSRSSVSPPHSWLEQQLVWAPCVCRPAAWRRWRRVNAAQQGVP